MRYECYKGTHLVFLWRETVDDVPYVVVCWRWRLCRAACDVFSHNGRVLLGRRGRLNPWRAPSSCARALVDGDRSVSSDESGPIPAPHSTHISQASGKRRIKADPSSPYSVNLWADPASWARPPRRPPTASLQTLLPRTAAQNTAYTRRQRRPLPAAQSSNQQYTVWVKIILLFYDKNH